MGDLGFEPRASGLRVRCATTAPVTLNLLVRQKSDLYTSKCLHKYITKVATNFWVVRIFGADNPKIKIDPQRAAKNKEI